MSKFNVKGNPLTLLSLLGTLLLGAPFLTGQEVANFKFSPGGYYDPPNEKQLKSLLTGAKARPITNSVWLILEGMFQTYLSNGVRELLVEAPQCIYNQAAQTLWSAGPLRVQAANGKFSIEGQGFLWRQTNSALFISNRVHTILHPDLFQGTNQQAGVNQTSPNTNGIEIFSDHFDYSGENGVGNYWQNLRVQSSDLLLNGGRMQFLLPMKQRTLQKLTIEEDVTLDSGETHATGQSVVYSPETGLIHLRGDPSWRQAASREGRGDELVIDPTNKIFQALGHAYLRITGQNASQPSLFLSQSSSNANRVTATNKIIEVNSDNYEIRTNLADFRDHVLVKEKIDDQTQGEMTCGHLTLTFSGTNQVDVMTAEQSVLITAEAKRFTADKAVYTGTNGVLELTGNPAWQDGARQGKGDLLRMSLQPNQLLVRSNAWLQLPARELGSAGSPAPISEALPGAKPASSIPPTNQVAEIFSSEYRLQTNSAWFDGSVRIAHPQMTLSCETVTATLSGSGERAGAVVAERSVAFDLLGENGQKIHGTGQKAVYTYIVTTAGTNDLVTLTGNPILLLTNGSTFRNDPVILDRANGKLRAPGKYVIHGVSDTGTTNFVLAPTSTIKGKKKVKSSNPLFP